MHPKRNGTSFQPGHRRSPESIEKQRETLRTLYATGARKPPSGGWEPEARAKREATNARKERQCESCGNTYRPVGGRQKICDTCTPDKAARRRYQRYKITQAQWLETIKRQGGTCALCSKMPTVADHDHETGRFRGALCNGCNVLLDRVSTEWITKAILYLKR